MRKENIMLGTRGMLFFFCLIISCTPKYILHTEKEFEDRLDKGKRMLQSGYIIIPYLSGELMVDAKTEENLLYQTVGLIKRKEWVKVNMLLDNAGSGTNLIPLCKGLNFFFKKDYRAALASLENYKGEDYKCLTLLLITDCHYELMKDSKEYQKFISEYQHVLDCTADPLQNEIIKTRVVYLKYEK
jgi:hypothetical protein